MNRLGAVFSVVLFSAACVATGCGPNGIDAVLECGSENVYVDCDQDTEPGSVSGFIGVNSVAFSCNVPNPQASMMPTTLDQTVVIRARIDYPVAGQQQKRATLLTSTGECAQVPPDQRSSLGTVMVDEFVPRSRIRGTFVSAQGKLHGTFDLECGLGNVFCGTVATPSPQPPGG